MYLEHFKLNEFPFSLASDPKFLYLSKAHARVKAQIEYALYIQDSLMVFTGEIGSGKTTLLHDALSHFDDNIIVARMHQTQLNEIEFLQLLLVEFGFELFEASKVELLNKLSVFLKDQFKLGKKVVLIIDEAQNLSRRVLEEIRLLSDLQNGHEKLMTVVIVGQPELNDMIDSPGMEQLVQRIRLRFHITALSEEEIQAYIKHRLSVAGASNSDIFSDNTSRLIYTYTGGRPRLLNILCDYALMHCAVEGKHEVTNMVIQEVIAELQWQTYEQRFGRLGSVSKNSDGEFNAENYPQLVVSKDGSEIGKFSLNKEYFSIGRRADNDFLIDNKKASRYHAQIVTNNGDSYLRDLDSTNGTYIGSDLVETHHLSDGEIFTIADISFQYNQAIGNEDSVDEEYGKILKYRKPGETV
ncbi:MAG: AAA family ATPase [Gammaproteobacteria bacterium]|nr:AAA family ATPase [Gammaproteobacteria bacterium]